MQGCFIKNYLEFDFLYWSNINMELLRIFINFNEGSYKGITVQRMYNIDLN